MVITTTNRLSLACIVVILLSSYTVSSLAVPSKIELANAWVAKCFIEGFNVVNSTVDCNEMKLTRELVEVTEMLKTCESYFKLGCSLGLNNFFCSEGVSRVLSNDPENADYPCNDIDIAQDTSNLAFECCTTCKNGYTDGTLNSKCTTLDTSNYYARARYRCCKAAATKTNVASLTTFKPILLNDNMTFDGMSEVLRDNEIKINESQSKKLNISGEALPTVMGSFNSSSEESVTPALISSTSTAESSSSTSQPSSSTADSNENDLPVSTEPSTSPSTASSTESLSVETSSIPTVSRAICDEGHRPSNHSNECEDINECEEDERICGRDDECFNLKGSVKCCPKGTEVPDGESECTYIDYCERKPCYQGEDDQHYCVDYFVGRLCEDKLVEGYKFMKGNEGVLELLDMKDTSSPRYLELTQKDITLDKDLLQRRGLINLKLSKGINCEWDFDFEAYAPLVGDKLQDDQFSKEFGPNVYKVWVDGVVKPQSVIISITCNVQSTKYYRNTIYFTFRNPQNRF